MCLWAACVCGVNLPFVIVCEVHATCNLVLLACFATSALCACACVANMHVFLCLQQSSSAACHLLQQKSTSADLLLLPLHTPSPPHSNNEICHLCHQHQSSLTGVKATPGQGKKTALRGEIPRGGGGQPDPNHFV